MRKVFSSAAFRVFCFTALGFGIPAALADTITITVAGTIDSANADQGFDNDFDGVFGAAGASLVGDTVSVSLLFDLSHEASTAAFLADQSFLPAWTLFIADASPQSVEVQTTINGTTVTGWAGVDSPTPASPGNSNMLMMVPVGFIEWLETDATAQPDFYTSLDITTGIPFPSGAVTQASPQDLAVLNESIPTESFALNDGNSVEVFSYQPGLQFAFNATPTTLSIQLDGSDLFAPEPSTVVLSLSCLTGLLVTRRWKQWLDNRKSGEIR